VRSSDAAEHLRSLDDDLKQKHGCVGVLLSSADPARTEPLC